MAMDLPAIQARTISQNSALDKLRGDAEPTSREQIRKSAEDFESLFLNIVLKSMRDTVQKSGLVDGGNAEDIYRSMLDEEYSKMMASQRHTGLADNIESFLLTAQAGIKAAQQTGKEQGIKAYQQQALPRSEKQATISSSVLPGPVSAPLPEQNPLSLPRF